MDNRVYLLLGSNEGDRLNNFNIAYNGITDKIGNIIQQSSLYETAAWGFKADNFLNQVILVNTQLQPAELISEIHKIEASAGRVWGNTKEYQPRPLDIDILFYNDFVLHTDVLQIPHPQLQNRRFTLVPLNEIAGDLIHPVLQLSINQLLLQCNDTEKVWLYNL